MHVKKGTVLRRLIDYRNVPSIVRSCRTRRKARKPGTDSADHRCAFPV